MSQKAVKAARKMAREMEGMREEILGAFVAQHGFNPDECQMVQEGNSWFVVRLEPEKIAQITRAIVVARLGRLNWWKRFCLRMAGI